jgi:hypothetical protein
MKGEMMRTRKSIGGAVLVVVAMLLVAIPASASAKTVLEFTEEGNAAPKGAPAFAVLSVGQECNSTSTGTLGEDPAKKVVSTYTALAEAPECEVGRSQTGHVEEEAWEANLKLKVKAHVEISYPGTCVYLYTKFTPEPFEVPGFGALAIGTTTGKLNKEASNKTKGACEKKKTEQFFTYVKDAEGPLFGLELVS